MKANDLIDIIGETADRHICDAKTGKKSAVPRAAKKWLAVAACFCLVASSIWLIDYRSSDEDRNNQHISSDGKYQIVTFDTNVITEPIKLFTCSVYPPADICDVVSQRHPNVDCTNAIYAFSCSEDTKGNYWFPVMDNGKIVDIVFATYGSKQPVITGHSKSHVDELNSIAKYTSKESPVYVVTGEYCNYYVIGGTAYVASNITGIEGKYIGDFFTPDEDIVVIEVS